MDERVYEIRGAPRHGGDAFLVLLVSTVAVLLVLIAYGRASGERDAEILEAMVQDAVMADKLALAGPGRSGPVEREWDLESVTGLRERAEVVIDADRGGRAAVVRASAVLILADQLESGAELAERAESLCPLRDAELRRLRLLDPRYAGAAERALTDAQRMACGEPVP